MTGFHRRIVAVLVVVVVAAPGLTSAIGGAGDSYPLSSYPMFARARTGPTVLHEAVVVDSDGVQHRLSPNDVSGTPEPLQATALIRRALDGDAGSLCAAVTGRIGALDPGERLLLLRHRVDAVAHYVDPGSATGDPVRGVDCSEETG